MCRHLSVLTFIDVNALTFGISPDFSFYLVSIANASSGFGRVTAGFLVDAFGQFCPLISSGIG